MTIKNTGEGHLAILSKPLDSRVKILSFANFVLFIVWPFVFIDEEFDAQGVEAILFLVAAAIVCFIAAYRFLNRAAVSEQLFIGGGELRLVKKSITTEVRVFPIGEVSQFRHLEKRTSYTRHPLAGDVFDSLGFQTQQELIKELNPDKRMAFDYDGKTISFGADVYSWEFRVVAGFVAVAGGDVVIRPGGEVGGVAVTVAEGADGDFRLPGAPEPVVWMAPEGESAAAADVYFMPGIAPGSGGESPAVPPAGGSV